MRAEPACYAVEVAIRRLVALCFARLVFERVFKRAVPAALEHLKGLLYNLRTLALRKPLFQRKNAVFHFIRGSVAGEAEAHRLAKVFFVVGYKIKRNPASAQNILRRVRAVSAFQQHCIAVFTRNVIRKAQRIRAEVCCAALRNRADKYHGHRKKCRGLIKIVYKPQIPKRTHILYSFYQYILCALIQFRYNKTKQIRTLG